MQAYKNDFLPDTDAIESDVRAPLTVEELRNRLKHIASLCWGLSIDLSTEMSECEKVRKENEQLRAQVVLLGGKLPGANCGGTKTAAKLAAMTPEEREKWAKKAQYRRAYATRKAKEKAKAAYAGGSDDND